MRDKKTVGLASLPGQPSYKKIAVTSGMRQKLIEDRCLWTDQASSGWITIGCHSDGQHRSRDDLNSHAREAPPDHTELLRRTSGEINNASLQKGSAVIDPHDYLCAVINSCYGDHRAERKRAVRASKFLG